MSVAGAKAGAAAGEGMSPSEGTPPFPAEERSGEGAVPPSQKIYVKMVCSGALCNMVLNLITCQPAREGD